MLLFNFWVAETNFNLEIFDNFKLKNLRKRRKLKDFRNFKLILNNDTKIKDDFNWWIDRLKKSMFCVF